ncbi:hypothetical protein SRB521_02932 [Intestinimonas butyriciproducens]|nr:hypothetical protein SRB521_02932 [Intestinimonas butyriciproducens]
MIRRLQYFANILCNRTRAAITGMNSDDGGHAIWLQCRIDLV